MGWLSLNDPEVFIHWEKDLYREIALSQDPLLDEAKGLAGDSDGKLVQVNTDLTQKPGGSIRFKKKYRIKGRGKVQDEVLKGSAGKYKTDVYHIYVDTLRNAVEVESPIQQQWVSEDALDESKDSLATWFAERMPLSLHLHAVGADFITDDAYTLNNHDHCDPLGAHPLSERKTADYLPAATGPQPQDATPSAHFVKRRSCNA